MLECAEWIAHFRLGFNLIFQKPQI